MKEQTFSPLPEHLAPVQAAGCARCELAGQRTRLIWGEGTPGAPVFVLLDNPGAREDKTGAPFVCGTRQTLQSLAHCAGLPLDLLYVTYVLKCRPRRAYDKRQARAACLAYLPDQVAAQRPRVVLCLGNIALQALLADETAEVKNCRGRWHEWRGLPLAVSYHPLAVRRRPNLFPSALADWVMVADRVLPKI